MIRNEIIRTVKSDKESTCLDSVATTHVLSNRCDIFKNITLRNSYGNTIRCTVENASIHVFDMISIGNLEDKPNGVRRRYEYVNRNAYVFQLPRKLSYTISQNCHR